MSDLGEKKQPHLASGAIRSQGAVAPPPHGSGNARARTLATMHRLGALAATMLVQGACNGCGSGGGGYGVVDPMPAPPRCGGVGATIKATAAWKPQADGTDAVELTLPKPTRSDATYTTTEDPSAQGGKIASKQTSADTVALTLVPEAGATSMSVRVATQCSEGPGHLSIVLDLTKKPSAVPVIIEDVW